MSDERIVMPCIPLRGLSVFPRTILHFDIGREKSIKALEAAMNGDKLLFVTSQIDENILIPTQDDYYHVGTVVKVKQMLKIQGDAVRVLVDGQYRAKLEYVLTEEPYIQTEISEAEIIPAEPDDIETEALMRCVLDAFDEYMSLNSSVKEEVYDLISSIHEPDIFADTIAMQMNIKISDKQEILEASLELFSVQGVEATSISQIASAVGIRKASLYSHFENKQAILDALVKEVLEQYAAHSIFARVDWEKDASGLPVTPNAAVQMIQGQIRYILHDPSISRARKMLIIEQFQNPELAKLQTKQNYSDVLRYFTGLVKQLIRQGVLAEDDPEIMAAQFCLPISVWINLCDREPERETEVMEIVSKHIRQFFRLYQRPER